MHACMCWPCLQAREVQKRHERSGTQLVRQHLADDDRGRGRVFRADPGIKECEPCDDEGRGDERVEEQAQHMAGVVGEARRDGRGAGGGCGLPSCRVVGQLWVPVWVGWWLDGSKNMGREDCMCRLFVPPTSTIRYHKLGLHVPPVRALTSTIPVTVIQPEGD